MSKKNKRITRAKYQPPQDAKIIPYSDKTMAVMMANSGPQKDVASAYSPGAPIPPVPGITLPSGPRGWQFPIGYNIGQLPRSTEATSFDTLRGLASLYDGVQLCQQVWFDLCSRLEIEIKPTDEALAAVKSDKTLFADDIARYKAFFDMPDRDEGLDLSSWLIKALRDQLEIDAVAIYVQLDKIGRPYALELIDAATIKPLIDARGRKPQQGFPAYQQFWQGVPLGLYTGDQMLYHRETQRTDSVYGLSRVERVIMRVNQALRKQNKDLSHFTEGNLPPGMLELPPSDDVWTPDDILTFQRIWDGLLSGNDKSRSRLKVVPTGSKYTVIADPDIMTPFDSFLLNTTAACHGLTMAELGFTENVNKSSGDSQEDVVYRRAMRPLTNRYARLFTTILIKYFKETRFVVNLVGFEENEDLETLSNTYGNLVGNGMLTIQQANEAMGLPYDEKEPIPRFIKTATGPVFFHDLLDPDIAAAKKKSQLAGFELAANPQPQGQEGDEHAQETQNNDKATSGTATKSVPQNTQELHEEPAQGQKRQTSSGLATMEAKEDYKRWRTRALDDVKVGRQIRPFVSTLIPVDTHLRIYENLQRCSTVEDVKQVFELERAQPNYDLHWQVTDVETQQKLAKLTAKGVKQQKWKSAPGCCDACLSNDGQVRAIGKPFASSALTTPEHNHCSCTCDEILEVK